MKNNFGSSCPVWLLVVLSLLLGSCGEDDSATIEFFTPGTMEASAIGETNIKAGESITFTSAATKAVSRAWTFQGGDPPTSTDSIVTVQYTRGGSFKAILEVAFVDNTRMTKEIAVEVEAPEQDPDPIIQGPTLGVYTENANIDQGPGFEYQPNNQFIIETTFIDPYEGVEARRFSIDGSSDWAMASIKPQGANLDLSEYADGYYNLALKSSSEGIILIRLQGGGKNAIITLDPAIDQYGFERDGEWHMLHIPIADFIAAEPGVDLSNISDVLVFRSSGDVRSVNNYEFFLDNFYFSQNLPD